MKKLITLFSLVLMTISVSAQSVRGDLNGDGQVTTTDVTEMYNIIFGTAAAPEGNMYFGTVAAPEGNMDFNVNGVTFKMVKVDGGTFQMGATSEQGSDASTNESPVHSVTLSDYWIGETEVTQALWQAVMGNNPSYFNGSNRPVEFVSWEDCQEFVNKLNRLLSGQLPAGRKFRLPTEAEWEFAARGGNMATSQTKYAGSNNIDDVAWYTDNSGLSTHDVATKAPNALGIYDMSGNVWEWCQDWYGSYSSGSQTNPTGPSSDYYSPRVGRGGSWGNYAWLCRVSYRYFNDPSRSLSSLGLRVALSEPAQSVRGDLNGDGEINTSDVTELYNIIFGTAAAAENKEFDVNGVTFKIVKVDGGTFQMGATSEQGSDAYSDEKPAHSVTLSDYWIGETEVTQALWQSVMGNNPSYYSSSNRPVEFVSWEDCQEFVNRLNNLLSGQLPAGRQFRLPTEAEWEFAARGGNYAASQTKYAGCDNIDDVAWYYDNSYAMGSSSPNYGTHEVATKAPNALGIYDMSGNVSEWCQDWYGQYRSYDQTNPTGPSSGSYRVFRGGSWGNSARHSRVSFRLRSNPSNSNNYLGLRVAL